MDCAAEDTKSGPAWVATEYLLQEQLDWEAKKGINRDNSTVSQTEVHARIDSLMESGHARRIVALRRLGMRIPAKHPGYVRILTKLRSELSAARQLAEAQTGTWAVDSEVADAIRRTLSALEARKHSGHS